MGLTTKNVRLTTAQKTNLLKDSNTYWRKYDVRLSRVFCDERPVDCFIVFHKIFISGCSEPQFSFAYTMNEKRAKELLGNLELE